VRVAFPSRAGVAMMSLIFCEHSGQNNVQESARTAWSGIYWCIDMMNSPPVGKNVAGDKAKPMAAWRLYKIAHWAPASRRQISGTSVAESLSMSSE
jgi:hypothetical protein